MSDDATGRLEGRTALITGASSGIGAATARLFAREGARVALVARRPTELSAVAHELVNGALVLPADVSRPEEVSAAVDEAERALGPIDVVVNSAGIADPALLEDLTDENWSEMIAVNLSGTFFVAKAAGLHMRRRGHGAIVNLGAELSFTGLEMCVAFCAAKAGIVGLTKALAIELAPHVRVNAVCPGPVDTPMLAGELAVYPDPVAARENAIKRVPLGRLAHADEVAEAILFAATARFATGSTFLLDGGVTAI